MIAPALSRPDCWPSHYPVFAGLQLRRFFGTADLSELPSDAISAGTERMQVELGLETDRGRRFALWSILHMLKSAPDLDVAFKDPADRDAARDFMDLLDQAEQG